MRRRGQPCPTGRLDPRRGARPLGSRSNRRPLPPAAMGPSPSTVPAATGQGSHRPTRQSPIAPLPRLSRPRASSAPTQPRPPATLGERRPQHRPAPSGRRPTPPAPSRPSGAPAIPGWSPVTLGQSRWSPPLRRQRHQGPVSPRIGGPQPRLLGQAPARPSRRPPDPRHLAPRGRLGPRRDQDVRPPVSRAGPSRRRPGAPPGPPGPAGPSPRRQVRGGAHHLVRPEPALAAPGPVPDRPRRPASPVLAPAPVARTRHPAPAPAQLATPLDRAVLAGQPLAGGPVGGAGRPLAVPAAAAATWRSWSPLSSLPTLPPTRPFLIRK